MYKQSYYVCLCGSKQWRFNVPELSLNKTKKSEKRNVTTEEAEQIGNEY